MARNSERTAGDRLTEALEVIRDWVHRCMKFIIFIDIH